MSDLLSNGVGKLSDRDLRIAVSKEQGDAVPAVVPAQQDLLEEVKEMKKLSEDKEREAAESGLVDRTDGDVELTPLGEYLLTPSE